MATFTPICIVLRESNSFVLPTSQVKLAGKTNKTVTTNRLDYSQISFGYNSNYNHMRDKA